MGRINIEIPDELHKDVKREAVEREETLKKTVIQLLGEGVDGNGNDVQTNKQTEADVN